jgi:beta-phosphoglucomutase
MDGVLVDSADHHYQSWRLLGNELGIDLQRDLFDQTFGRQNKDIIPIVFAEVDPERVRVLGERKEMLYRDLIRDDPPVVEGAVALVHALHDCGASLAVGSSAPRANVELVLAAMGVSSVFSAIVTGDEVTRGKPDPQVFTLCCEALQLDPDRCVVIEDAPAGVEAALAAGTRAVAVMIHHDASAFANASLRISSLQSLDVGVVVELLHT